MTNSTAPRGDGFGTLATASTPSFYDRISDVPSNYQCDRCGAQSRLWTDPRHRVRLCAEHATEYAEVPLVSIDQTGLGNDCIGWLYPAIPCKIDPSRLIDYSDVAGDAAVWWRSRPFQ